VLDLAVCCVPARAGGALNTFLAAALGAAAPDMSSWRGDPCNPVPWTGLTCASNKTQSSVLAL